MAKDDSTVRCFQGLLIFGHVIVGVSREYFSKNCVLLVSMVFRLTKSKSLRKWYSYYSPFILPSF